MRPLGTIPVARPSRTERHMDEMSGAVSVSRETEETTQRERPPQRDKERVRVPVGQRPLLPPNQQYRPVTVEDEKDEDPPDGKSARRL